MARDGIFTASGRVNNSFLRWQVDRLGQLNAQHQCTSVVCRLSLACAYVAGGSSSGMSAEVTGIEEGISVLRQCFVNESYDKISLAGWILWRREH